MYIYQHKHLKQVLRSSLKSPTHTEFFPTNGHHRSAGLGLFRAARIPSASDQVGKGISWMIGETDGATLPTINRKMLTSSPDEWSIESLKFPHPKWRDLNRNSHTNLIWSRISSGIPLFQGLDGRNRAKIHSSTSLVLQRAAPIGLNLHNGYSTTGYFAPFLQYLDELWWSKTM